MPASETDLLQVITSAANLGLLAVAFWLFVGGRLHSSAEIERLEKETARVVAEKEKAEAQRDAAMEIAQRELLPLLASFTAATNSLLPVLQDLVRMREGERHYREDRGDRYGQQR
jgi:hypothetical protein